MAWSWSHTGEAYKNAEDNLRQLDRDTLEVIYAEWKAAEEKGGFIDGFSPQFNERKYNRALKKAKKLPDDTLADFIWNKASEFAICENGGHSAWMCPHGCGCHLVSFSPELVTN